MLSEKQSAPRSPTSSAQTGSVVKKPTTTLSGQQSSRSSRSSISSISGSEDIPSKPSVLSINRTAVKSPSTSASVSPVPLKPKTTTTTTATPVKPKTTTGTTATPVKPTPTTGTTSTPVKPKTTTGTTSTPLKPTTTTGTTSTPLKPIPTTGITLIPSKPITNTVSTTLPQRLGNISPLHSTLSHEDSNEHPDIIERILMQIKPTPISASKQQKGKKNQKSIFEKVDRHNGRTTYLGSGSYSQLEDCIRDCLGRDRSHKGNKNHTPKHFFHSKNLTRASVLEDYSYDGIPSPIHHKTRSKSNHHYSDYDSDHSHHHSDHHSNHHSNHHSHHHSNHHSGHHATSATDLSLSEIRQVNDALAKCGISITSHHEHHGHHHDKPGSVGEVISACRRLVNDSSHGGGHAVQNVWDAMSHYQPPMNNSGYGPPGGTGNVLSRLFNNTQQNSYNPVQGVASHLFNNQQNPYSPVQGVASHLFNNQQNSYNPVQGVASHLFNNQQNSYSPVQGVASHLFSGQDQHFTAAPFNNSSDQYSGNNHFTY